MSPDPARDEDVLILGAGPVGLTLANELIRHGVTPRIVDKAGAIREVSKAMILHVRTQEVLDKVGIAERACREAQPLTEVVVHAYGKHIGSWDLDGIDGAYPHPLILGQHRTQHLLLDLLRSRGSDVEWNTEAVDVALDDAGASIRLRASGGGGDARETTVRSRFVVGCEGSNSLVRRTLGFTFEGERYAGEQFIQADCRIRWHLPRGRSYLFLTALGYLMVIEFPDGMVRIFLSLPDDHPAGAGAIDAAKQLGAAEALQEQPTLDEIRDHLVRLTGFDSDLGDATWLARYRTSHRYSNRFSRGPAFIAGDAAHVHVPIGGQGMNTGIQDAFNLGWKLAGVCKGTLRRSVLDTYHDERHPIAESLIRGTDVAYRGILHPSEIRQRAARLLGPFLIRSERVQGFMRSTLEELAVAYLRSALNLDLGGHGPAPGERVLDATLVRSADRETVSLNTLTRSTSWTLLLFSGPEAGRIESLTALRDQLGGNGNIAVLIVVGNPGDAGRLSPSPTVFFDFLHEAHRRYGVSGPAFHLLRPDTFVAARGPITRADELMGYLATVFST